MIVDENSYADFSVSVSPAIEKAVVKDEVPPTVYLNIFDVDSITIGFNEDPEQALDIEFCREKNVSFRRRPNGGGPVYAGAGSAFLVFFLLIVLFEVFQCFSSCFTFLFFFLFLFSVSYFF